jgi:urease alpha subunit
LLGKGYVKEKEKMKFGGGKSLKYGTNMKTPKENRYANKDMLIDGMIFIGGLVIGLTILFLWMA